MPLSDWSNLSIHLDDSSFAVLPMFLPMDALLNPIQLVPIATFRSKWFHWTKSIQWVYRIDLSDWYCSPSTVHIDCSDLIAVPSWTGSMCAPHRFNSPHLISDSSSWSGRSQSDQSYQSGWSIFKSDRSRLVIRIAQSTCLPQGNNLLSHNLPTSCSRVFNLFDIDWF